MKQRHTRVQPAVLSEDERPEASSATAEDTRRPGSDSADGKSLFAPGLLTDIICDERIQSSGLRVLVSEF